MFSFLQRQAGGGEGCVFFSFDSDRHGEGGFFYFFICKLIRYIKVRLAGERHWDCEASGIVTAISRSVIAKSDCMAEPP